MVRPKVRVPARKRVEKSSKQAILGVNSYKNKIDKKPAVSLQMHLDKLEKEYKKQKRKQFRRRMNSKL